MNLPETPERLDHARIPVRYRAADIAQIPAVVAYARDLDTNLKSGRGLLLIGPANTGKTESACALCRRALSRNPRVMYISAPDLVAELDRRTRFDDTMTMAEALKDRLLLVIDDLGSELDGRTASRQTIPNLIRTRVNDSRATILVTHLSETELAEAYGAGLLPMIQRASIIVHTLDTGTLERGGKPRIAATSVKPYSKKDKDVYSLIGVKEFRSHSNDELRKSFARQLKEDLGIVLKGESGRTILNRIRRFHGLPSSDDVRRKAVNPDVDERSDV